MTFYLFLVLQSEYWLYQKQTNKLQQTVSCRVYKKSQSQVQSQNHFTQTNPCTHKTHNTTQNTSRRRRKIHWYSYKIEWLILVIFVKLRHELIVYWVQLCSRIQVYKLIISCLTQSTYKQTKIQKYQPTDQNTNTKQPTKRINKSIQTLWNKNAKWLESNQNETQHQANRPKIFLNPPDESCTIQQSCWGN